MSNRGNISTPNNRQNCFGILRLIFASLVIVSHTPEIIDGNRSREILTSIFGTISFGEFAVDCFFLVSGYLITASVMNKRSAMRYLIARVARIYPAFVVSFLFCLLVVAPLSGASAEAIVAAIPIGLAKMLVLLPPTVAGTFAGTHYPGLNLAAWTISYEFFCYILALLLFKAGVLQRRILLVGLAALTLATFVAVQTYVLPHLTEQNLASFVIIHAARTFRLAGIFLVGAVYHVWRDAVAYRASGALVAVILLAACLSSGPAAEPGLAVFGGYVIFYLADAEFMQPLQSINNKNDISYGIYLYSWPIEKLILWYIPGIDLIQSAVFTLIIAAIFGSISWIMIERPVLSRVRRFV